jgi:DNA-binding XRE family transcriptional regulator
MILGADAMDLPQMGMIVRGLIIASGDMLSGMNSHELSQLGGRIRQKRKQIGLTQEGLAYKADIDRSYIGGVERGERNLTFTVLCSICHALECDVAALTEGIPGT